MRPHYERGGVKLFNCDCLEWLPTLEAGSVDLVVTDPQYGVSMPGVCHTKGGRKGSRNFDFFHNDTYAEASKLAKSAIALAEPLLAKHGSGYAWVSHRLFAALTIDIETRGWTTRFLTWEKLHPCPPPPGSGWPSAVELCLYWFRSGRRWAHDGRNYPRSNGIRADSYRYGQLGKVDHPTQKPLECVTPLILASSLPGDLVLDCFLGSGTTGVACVRLGCRFLGCEIDRRYFDIACKRIDAAIDAQALFHPEPPAVRQSGLFDSQE